MVARDPILSPEEEDEVEPLSLKSEEYTPDDVLQQLGPRNPFLLTCIIITALTWTAMALNGLSAAFVTQNCHNCTDMESLVDEFHLRNESAYLADLTTTSFMVGNMLGGTMVSQAGDRYGRRPVLLVCLVMMTLTGVLAALAPTVQAFAAARFLQGMFYTGGALVGWVLGYECTPLQLRFFTTVLFGMAWVLGYCLVTPLAYFAPNWRWLIFLVSAPHAIMAVICYFFVPDSLHFLVSSNRTVEVQSWLRRAEGGVERIEPITIVNTKTEEERPESLCAELWKHKRFLMFMSVLIYMWICDTFIYFGLSLYSTHLAGNVYLNYFLMGLVEIPAYILSPMAMDRYGRRFVLAGTHIMAAVMFFGLMFAPADSSLSIGLWLLGKFAISCSFMSIYVYASEIFPTNIRNLSIGFCEMMSRIGGILAPFISTLSLISPQLPMIILSAISLIGGILTFLLPETLNRPLPSTIEESARRNRN